MKFVRCFHIDKNWTDFNGGNIFWINQVIDENLTSEFCDYLKKIEFHKPDSNLKSNKIIIEYLCERLFTINFCYKSTNVLVNNYYGTVKGYNVKYGKLLNKNIYQPKIISIYKPKEIMSIFN